MPFSKSDAVQPGLKVNQTQRIVLFDAVGTVIKPSPGVTDVYHRLGSKYGSELSQTQIKQRIIGSRQKYFKTGESAQTRFADMASPIPILHELNSSDELERGMWQQLVFDVFSDLDSPGDLFDELWEHFRLTESWLVYPDVEACWNELSSRGFEIGIATNFDSRLIALAEWLPPLPSADYVFCSSQVGFRKPSPMFYRQIESAINCLNIDRTEDAAIFMVGDDFENDYVAPNLAGWNSVWLNRDKPTSSGARKKCEVGSLEEFTRWLLASQTAD